MPLEQAAQLARSARAVDRRRERRSHQKYARRSPIHLHRRVAKADTLSTVIEGLYDPDAAAQGAPSVHYWFLGHDADGTPQFCGLPAHHTCPHRMDCSRCGLFIGGERAKLVHADSSLLRVTAEVPMTEVQRLLNAGQREAAERALAAAKEVTRCSQLSNAKRADRGR
jgi:hypothetical protein